MYWYSCEYNDAIRDHWDMIVYRSNYVTVIVDEYGDECYERTQCPYPVVPPLAGPEPPPMYGPRQYNGGPYSDYMLF